MSGIYIPDMEMPDNCYQCPCADLEYFDCNLMPGTAISCTRKNGDRLPDCPLIPVPDHGRLGDLDKLENGLRHMAKYQYGERQQGILGCCETIRLAPTIIPADA